MTSLTHEVTESLKTCNILSKSRFNAEQRHDKKTGFDESLCDCLDTGKSCQFYKPSLTNKVNF